MSTDLGYINARLRGMHSHFLIEKNWLELLQASSLEAMASALSNTSYAKNLEEARANRSGIALWDYALSLNWRETLVKIRSFIEGKVTLALDSALWLLDLNHLKVIISACLSGKEAALETPPLLGYLSIRHLEELARARSIKEIATFLSLFHHPLAEVILSLPAQEELNTLETEVLMEKGYFALIKTKLSRPFSLFARSLWRYWQEKIDWINLRSAYILQELKEGRAPHLAELFIPGGQFIGLDCFLLLARKETLERGWAKLAIEPRFRLFKAIRNAEELEIALAKRGFEESKRLYQNDPLGVGLIMAFLYQKEIEISNLRLLAHSKNYNLPSGTVRERLVL